MTIEEVIKEYDKQGMSAEEIRERTGIKVKDIINIIGIKEKITELNAKDKENIERLDNLNRLSSGEMIKGEYSNNWLGGASNIVSAGIAKQIALEMVNSNVYENLYIELKELVEWEKEELKKLREEMKQGNGTEYAMNERLRLIKAMKNTQLKAMGIKGEKGLSELIERVGVLNIGEEKLILEKTKYIREDENIQKTRNLLEKLTEDID